MLVRHAKSAWPPEVPDHDRPLGRRGLRDAPAVGRWLHKAGCVPDLVLCSTARRAAETWRLAESELDARPQVSYERRVYEDSADGLLQMLRRLPSMTATVLMVGHNPAIQDLAMSLARDQEADGQPQLASLAGMREKFPTAAIAVLQISGPWFELARGDARLASFVTPRDLHGT